MFRSGYSKPASTPWPQLKASFPIPIKKLLISCQPWAPHPPLWAGRRRKKCEISSIRWLLAQLVCAAPFEGFQCVFYLLSLQFSEEFHFTEGKRGWEDIIRYPETNSPQGDLVFLYQHHWVISLISEPSNLLIQTEDRYGMCIFNMPSDSDFKVWEPLEWGISFHALAWKVRVTESFPDTLVPVHVPHSFGPTFCWHPDVLLGISEGCNDLVTSALKECVFQKKKNKD